MESGGLQGIFHRFKIGGRGQHLNGAVFIGDHVFGACFQRHFHYLVFAGAGCEHKLPAVLELERHRAFGAQVATMLAENVAHFGHGAHLVVGHGVNDDGRPANAVAFVADFLVVHAFKRACRLVDVAFDGVGRHVGRLGLVDGQTQTGIGRHIAAAMARRHDDFANDAGPDFAALFVLAPFTVLDIGPLAMACHAFSLAENLV